MNEKKNIAILIPGLCGGGAERAASILSQYLENQGYPVYIFTKKRTRKDYKCGGKVITLPSVNESMTNLFPQLNTRQMIRTICLAKSLKEYKRRYNIHVAISFLEELNLANIFSKGKEKVIIRICSTLSAYSDMQEIGYSRNVLRYFYNKADTMIVLSKYGKQDMVNCYHIDPSIIRVIPNPALLSEHETCEKKSWDYGENVIVSVARIQEVKQQKAMIQCFETVKESIPDAKLLFIGNDRGSYGNQVKSMVRNLHLEGSVIFAGQVSSVSYYLKHSKIFILLSKNEGFPNAMAEAMAEGVPVISTDCPSAVREILNPGSKPTACKHAEYGKYGILVPCIDEDAKNNEKEKTIIAQSMIAVLKDKELQHKYSMKARKRAGDFSLQRIGRIWEKTIESGYEKER